MEISGKVHCWFEQSGTFKGEFMKLGIPAADYDIRNDFGQTDFVTDLFAEIESAHSGGASIYDSVTEKDLIMAFFPCIYFSALSQMAMSFGYRNYRDLGIRQKAGKILERSSARERFFRLAVMMITEAEARGLRLIMENPWAEQTFLKANFVMPPTLVDSDRTTRGDYYRKPTAYWFVNCEPSLAFTSEQNDKARRTIMNARPSEKAGICSTERSMISPDYARNFICDFILGRPQQFSQQSLF